MIITVGGIDYELKTNLGVAVKIEQKFKMPLINLFAKLESAEIPELVSILSIASSNPNGDVALKVGIEENWDYTDLQFAVQELISKLMFSGTPEQIEKKLEKFPPNESQKNAIREMLGLPNQNVSTENSSSEPLIE
jgi:hypothetical protein